MKMRKRRLRRLTRQIDEREVENGRSRDFEDDEVLSEAVLFRRTERRISDLNRVDIERNELGGRDRRVEHG